MCYDVRGFANGVLNSYYLIAVCHDLYNFFVCTIHSFRTNSTDITNSILNALTYNSILTIICCFYCI